MDPNEALREARELAHEVLCDSESPPAATELAEKFQALDEWLREGGFLPDAWKREGVR